MIYPYSTQNSLTFTSRCPQIRDAQWVCHCVNDNFPHFSTTKFKPLFEKLLRKSAKSAIKQNYPMNIEILKRYLEEYSIAKDNKHKNNFFCNALKYLTGKIFKINFSDKNANILAKAYDRINDLGEKRRQCSYGSAKNCEVFGSLNLLEKFKLANCYETAIIAEFILKLNGIKNACTVALKNNNALEHIVCVFNRDGSPFSKFSNNNTIIIDPWAGKADFAGKMLKFYRNMHSNNFILSSKINGDIRSEEFVNLEGLDINYFIEKYPNLIFKSASHPFMQIKK